MKTIRVLFLSAAVVLAATGAWAAAPAAPQFAQRWNYISTNINDDQATDKLIDLLKQSKDVGCTHIAFSAGGICRLERLTNPDYIRRVAKVRAAAQDLHLTLIPMIFAVGYSGDTLSYDGNLLAGLPIRDEPFVVHGKTAEPDAAAVPAIKNAGFEDFQGNKLADWQQDGAGKITTIDQQVKHDGKASLKISVTAGVVVRGNEGLVVQKIPVKPFQYYHLWCWLKTSDYKVSNAVMEAYGHDGKQLLTYWNLGLTNQQKASNDWVKFGIIVNTLDNDQITLQIGDHWGAPGTIWFDDIHFEPAGLLLALHRDTAPLVVKSQDGVTTYVEGKDYKPVLDPNVQDFAHTGDLDCTHRAPVLELTDNSSIKDGQRLLISFYASQTIDVDQNVVTMQDPKVLQIFDRAMDEITKVWPAPGYFMSGYDEIRIAGWEPNPNGEKLTCGQILARHTKASYDIIKKHAPTAAVYTWQDMYSPYHNADPARPYYYLCNGNYDKSWEGIPNDIIMMNWYSPKRDGVKFFSDRGYHQVLCGFYDGKSTVEMKRNIKTWFDVSAGLPNIDGLMYTTWNNNYASMKPYFDLVNSYPWRD